MKLSPCGTSTTNTQDNSTTTPHRNFRNMTYCVHRYIPNDRPCYVLRGFITKEKCPFSWKGAAKSLGKDEQEVVDTHLQSTGNTIYGSPGLFKQGSSSSFCEFRDYLDRYILLHHIVEYRHELSQNEQQ